MRGGSQFQGWGVDRYLMAALIDSVRENTYATVAANSGKRKPKKPEPVTRPSKNNGLPKDNHTNPFRQQLMAARKAKEAT